jgi:hypothetical protein
VHPFSRLIIAFLCGIGCCCVSPGIAVAVGWGPTDFLIMGAPNFPDRIGVFDQNFVFKGNIFTNWVGLQAMNFDRQGRLITYNYFANEVRVYDPSGALVGGFNSTISPMLTPSGDIQVMPDGNYIVGTQANGARVFTPLGTFVRQYGDGASLSISLLPGHRLWSGNFTTLTTKVFDTDTGLQTGSFTMDQQTEPSYMNYYASTNTVLCIDTDRDAGGVYERDLSGVLLQQFHVPHAQIPINGATRGPGGDVFGTHSPYPPSYYNSIHWSADGAVLDQKAIWPVEVRPARLLWVGNVPEPRSTVLVLLGFSPLLMIRSRNERGRHHA